ncbi:hypothetical protein pdam_00010454 [Pocillopora damicornis]|uniref:Galaxin-like repeats domain-containing protein n=1 Tax=Pocillopora damicornis TaxID=46731 RepID=A0A3M6UA89_POCDA|nr:hypothetical protein pdam_00010454 [Pocillopora damicornis]
MDKGWSLKSHLNLEAQEKVNCAAETSTSFQQNKGQKKFNVKNHHETDWLCFRHPCVHHFIHSPISYIAMDQCQAWRRPCGLETIDRRNGREPRSLKEIRYYDRCCGVQYYDPERQLCCFGNRVLPKKSGDACCGSRKYNVHTELCCGFTVKKKTGSQNACCGAVPYDSRRYTCCGGTVTPRASSHQHLNSCCGKTYDPRSQVCCGGKIVSTPSISSPACCGSNVYDRNQQICCSNVLFDKPKNPSGIQVGCCGSNIMFTSHQMCCAGKVVGKPQGVQNPRCCGNRVYNSQTQVCCSNRVSNGKVCCGNVGYNPLTHSCCGSMVIKGSSLSTVHGPQRKCCGRTFYDPRFEDCCHGRYSRRRGCCYNNNQWGDSRQKFRQLCRDDY